VDPDYTPWSTVSFSKRLRFLLHSDSIHCYTEYTIHNDELNEWNTFKSTEWMKHIYINWMNEHIYINWMNEAHLQKLNEWNTFT
jgi:hypothetical protein